MTNLTRLFVCQLAFFVLFYAGVLASPLAPSISEDSWQLVTSNEDLAKLLVRASNIRALADKWRVTMHTKWNSSIGVFEFQRIIDEVDSVVNILEHIDTVSNSVIRQYTEQLDDIEKELSQLIEQHSSGIDDTVAIKKSLLERITELRANIDKFYAKFSKNNNQVLRESILQQLKVLQLKLESLPGLVKEVAQFSESLLLHFEKELKDTETKLVHIITDTLNDDIHNDIEYKEKLYEIATGIRTLASRMVNKFDKTETGDLFRSIRDDLDLVVNDIRHTNIERQLNQHFTNELAAIEQYLNTLVNKFDPDDGGKEALKNSIITVAADLKKRATNYVETFNEKNKAEIADQFQVVIVRVDAVVSSMAGQSLERSILESFQREINQIHEKLNKLIVKYAL